MIKLPTEYIDLGDIRMAYRQNGSGQALLLLHGNSENKSIFGKYQTDYFAGMNTFALDSRCHGESQSQDDSLSIEQISDDVIKFCKAMNIKEAFVIGYSDGGNIALFLAKKAPQLFSKVIAVSPNTLVSGSTDGFLRLSRAIIAVFKFLQKLGFNFKKQLLVIDLMMRDIGLSWNDLKGIKTSVKVIYAEKDLIKEEHIREIAAAIPNSTLDKVMGCTHMSIIYNMTAIRIMQEYLLYGK